MCMMGPCGALHSNLWKLPSLPGSSIGAETESTEGGICCYDQSRVRGAAGGAIGGTRRASSGF
jgi:hypothetical protein